MSCPLVRILFSANYRASSQMSRFLLNMRTGHAILYLYERHECVLSVPAASKGLHSRIVAVRDSRTILLLVTYLTCLLNYPFRGFYKTWAIKFMYLLFS